MLSILRRALQPNEQDCAFEGRAAKLWRRTWPSRNPIPALGPADAVGRPHGGLEDLLAAAGPTGESVSTIMEIGVELGGSTRFFLRKYPKANIVSIDSWTEEYPFPSDWSHLKEYTKPFNGRARELFMSFCWNDRQRLLPIHSWSDAGARRAFNLGIRPDLIYIDGDHRYHGVLADLFLCSALFPKAVLCGDDWDFRSAAPKYRGYAYPVREAVQAFASHKEARIEVVGNSYIIGSVGSARGDVKKTVPVKSASKQPPSPKTTAAESALNIARQLREDLSEQQLVALAREGFMVIPEKMSAQYLSRFDFNPDVIIDVGVSNGSDFLYEAFPDKLHVLVEPQPGFETAIKRRFGEKYRFSFENCAAGATSGVATLKVQGDNASKSTLGSPTRIQGQNTTREVEVAVRTLDEIVRDTPGSIGLKIDTEGHELSVLKGATETLSRAEFVLAEVSIKNRFEGGYRFSDIVLFMKQNGFEVIDTLNPIWRVHMFWDCLFVKSNSSLFSSRKV